MSKRTGKLPRVELLNVPSYRQGTFDGLCTYYTAAMMLSALFPEYTRNFGAAARRNANKNMSNDPLIKNYGDGDHKTILARWYYHGETVSKATAILNKTMRSDGKSTRFSCQLETAHSNTFHDVIAGSINDGLPVMLGWCTPDYGNHAVLISGYWEGSERWLLINDPGDDAYQISWDSLTQQKKKKFEVGLCKPKTHTGYRPLKTYEDAQGSSTTVYRWTSKGYKPVKHDFS